MSKLSQLLLVVSLAGSCLAVLYGGRAKTHSNSQAIGKSGISFHAKSSSHCLQLCNSHQQCDAANYHTETGKCRILHRCSSYRLVDSPKHQHFAKRPPIIERGYIYDDASDSCLKVIERLTDYQGADVECKNLNGRLAALLNPDINMRATKLLRDSGVQYAWIGLTDNLIEGDPRHTSGDRVSQTGFFPLAKQGHRNDTTKNCWSLTDSGEWAEQSCKDRKQYSICQILPF